MLVQVDQIVLAGHSGGPGESAFIGLLKTDDVPDGHAAPVVDPDSGPTPSSTKDVWDYMFDLTHP